MEISKILIALVLFTFAWDYDFNEYPDYEIQFVLYGRTNRNNEFQILDTTEVGVLKMSIELDKQNWYEFKLMAITSGGGSGFSNVIRIGSGYQNRFKKYGGYIKFPRF